ncbi:MAG TPA: tRNA pseudouridine(38-40) synthase TruA [Bacteroidota bacterium]|nr:tRNA pseudouridine(38-40) synthase TruA [Bacteroidota bacterium]
MKNVKLTLEYDGTDFVGWQIQPNGRSVQEVVEKALGTLLQEDIRTNAAGRTDAGVHARGQVVNFKTSKEYSLGEIQKGLNALLPEDVAVLRAEEVPDDFHARYSARERSYSYHIVRQPSALMRKFTWYVGYKLDSNLLVECSRRILGEHDFQSFSKNGSATQHYRCIVRRADWEITDASIIFRVSANRFLYGMVRAMVGTMIEVARGYRTLEEFEDILRAKDRSKAGMSAPAQGLFLEEVVY